MPDLIRRIPSLAVAAGAFFLLLGALVAHGTYTPLDERAVLHLMPWLQPPFTTGTDVVHMFVPHRRDSLGHTLVELATFPAGVPPSALVVACCAVALRRRGLGRAGAVWIAAWIAANAVEVIGKGLVTRPPLFSHGLHVASFDQSYPSGHALRAGVLAAAVCWTWPRAWPVLVWALGVPFALVALGAHTPTDVVGGVLAAVALSLAAGYVCARWVISPSTTVSSTGTTGSSSGSQATGSSASTVRSPT